MKKILAVVLTLIMMISVFAIPASASAVVMGGYSDMNKDGVYYALDTDLKTAEVVGYELNVENASAGELVVPNSVSKRGVSYTVTGIGIGAFYQSMYTKITLPASITYIDSIAFMSSIYLDSVVIPDSCVLDYVGSDLFMGTPFEETVYESNAFYVGSNVLYKFNGSGEFVIPENVNILAPNCFMWSDIEKVIFNNNIVEIPSYCFSSCWSLTDVVFSDSIVNVGEGAFKDCTSLEEITLGKNVATLGLDCFANTRIKSIYLSTEICEVTGAFRDCTTLETIAVAPGHSMLFAKNNCIYKNSTFLGVDENGDMENIEGIAIVYSNPKYTSGVVTLPNEVMLIEDYAFYGCKNLEELSCNNIMSVGTDAFRNSGIKAFNANGMIGEEYLIYDGSFANCKNLTTINIENAAIIGDSAFENCTSLVNVKLNENLLYLGAKAFANTGIKEITVKNCAIDEGAFMNCENLETVTIGDGVTEIYKNAFLGCPNLKTISLSADIEYIDENAFNGCENVTFKVTKHTYAYNHIVNLDLNFEVVGKLSLWERIVAFFRRIFGI